MQNKENTYRFLLSAGGTGGHIFPAISVADALKEKFPGSEFLFIGSSDRMEMQKVPAAGYDIRGIKIEGIARKLSLKMLFWPIKLLMSIIDSIKIIRKFKPDMAMGFGGFASGPALYAAGKLGIKTLIQEQNSYAGITNKLLAPKASSICVAYDKMERYFPSEKIIKTGNPVRKDIKNFVNNKEIGLSHFSLNHENPVLFVFGGSQGALAINQAMYALLDDLLSNNFQIIWQCGSSFFEKAQEKVNNHELKQRVKVFEFITEMEKAYQAADFIVARSGALSISELCLVAKPVIFVPLPTAAEDHQTKNAMALVEKNAALILKNSEVRRDLLPALLDLQNDKDKQVELSKNIAAEAIPDATDRIIVEIEKVLKS